MAAPAQRPKASTFQYDDELPDLPLPSLRSTLAGLRRAVLAMRPILPYALAYAAGAMIFVVVEDAVPESQLHGNTDIATLGAMLGFAVMMTLDVALG